MGIISVVLAIIVITILAAKRINLGLAMLAGGLVIILTAPLNLAQITSAAQAAFTDGSTWTLMGAVVLIGILGYTLKESGTMDVMMDSLLRLIGDPRLLAIVLPGMIGSLSVPGGAMMSAPIIDQLGERTGISGEHRAGINMVYRHIWYPIFPIVPGMILAAGLAGLETPKLALQNIPALLVGLISSWFLLLHRLPGKAKGKWSTKDALLFLASIMPIALVITAYLVFKLNFVLAMLIGLGYAFINLPSPGSESLWRRMCSTGAERIKTMLPAGFRPGLILVVAGIMFFKELIFASGLINSFALDLVEQGIPMWLLLGGLPFLVGLATGHHEAAIGIVIPVFASLLSGDLLPGGIGLVYIAATMGYLISPLHLCMILTREYFQANFKKMYCYIAPVPLLMFLTGIITALVKGIR